MKTIRFLLIALFISLPSFSQTIEQPKLVVGIVVDQMRYDYLTRFSKYYGGDGLKRLTSDGSNFTYGHLNYVPTFTAPGHASIYTGTTPFFHGIIANDWFDRVTNHMVSSVEDHTVQTLGVETDEGQASPNRLLTNTITDQLKIATNGNARVISISIKDRASILPGGHSADAAYWYSHKEGKFITSSYYMDNLPKWVEDFNQRKLPDSYISEEWNLSLPDSDYQISYPDEALNESDVFKEGRTSFPHSLKNIDRGSKYATLISTPFGNQLVLEFAKAAITNEELGKHSVPDFLAISFSSTDYIGHEYGPNSVEIEDTYIKLDKQIAELLTTLDNQVGRGNYLLFLSADHGVMESTDFLKRLKINGDIFAGRSLYDSLKSFAVKKYNNEKIIRNFSNQQIFLNYKLIENENLDINEVEENFANYIMNNLPQAAFVQTREELQEQFADRNSNNLILNGFNFKRSGDLAFNIEPNNIADRKKGSTHGTRYNYDTHIPIIFYGWHVPAQQVNTSVYTVDIAPTVANLIGITEPNGCIGIPIIKSK